MRVAGSVTGYGFLVLIAVAAMTGCGGGQPQAFRAPRTPDNTPDLSGIWQAINTANWDLEPHQARMGPVVALAAAFSIPPGLGVVEGDEIPYLPAALEKRNQNRADWVKLDPEIKCYMPGIPRATYMPFPFQIVQSTSTIMMAYEFTSASRVIRMNSKDKSPAPAWMGWSVGRWEGDTLVIDTMHFVGHHHWIDSGIPASTALHIVERVRMINDGKTLEIEYTLSDPKGWEGEWKMTKRWNRQDDRDIAEVSCLPDLNDHMPSTRSQDNVR